MGQNVSIDEATGAVTHPVDRELDDLRRHASDLKVTAGLMRGVLRTVQRSRSNTDRFIAVMLAPEVPITISPRRNTLLIGQLNKSALTQRDDSFRHPLSILFQKTIAANTANVAEMALLWIEFLLETTSNQFCEPTDGTVGPQDTMTFSSTSLLTHFTPNETPATQPSRADAHVITLMESHGIGNVFLHVFELQEHAPLSSNTSNLLARLVRTFSESRVFLKASIRSPTAIIRALHRLRFARPNSEERHSLIDFVFNFMRFDSVDSSVDFVEEQGGVFSYSNDSVFTAVHDGAACLASHATSQLHLAIDALINCIDSVEKNIACVGRALRCLTYLCRAVCANTSAQITGLPFGEVRLCKLFAIADRGTSVLRDLSAIACLAVDNDPEASGEKQHGSMFSSADSMTTALQYPLEVVVHDSLSTIFDVKFIEKGDVDPLDLLQLCDIAHSTLASIRGLVMSRNLTLILNRCADVAITCEKGTRHWLRLVARISSDATQLADPFSNSGGLDVLLGIIETAQSRQHVYDSVSAIQRLCTTDASRIRLLQQRNFHALLRTISPKGSGEQMIAALETVTILKSMMTPSVLQQADSFLIDAIHSLLCQALAHCPLVNPRTRSVDASYIITAQGVMQSLLELLLMRARTSTETCRTIYHQLPLDRLRELIQQSWYPIVQQTAKDLSLVMTSVESQRSELLEYQIVSIHDVHSNASSTLDVTELQRSSTIGRLPNSIAQKFLSSFSVTSLQRKWRRILQLRKLSNVRVGTASLFKTAFLQYNEVVESERKEFEAIRLIFDSHVSRIEDQYRERELLELDASDRIAILIPETAERCTIGLWFTEDFETLLRQTFARRVESDLDALKSSERLWNFELGARQNMSEAQRKENDALFMRHTQGVRAIDRLYDQRRHLESVEDRFRIQISEERQRFEAEAAVSLALLVVQAKAIAQRQQIHTAALNEFVEIRTSLYPVLIDAIVKQEDRRRETILQSAARLFAASSNQLAVLALQNEEEDLRQREERWAHRVMCAFSSRYYTIALRQCEQRERTLRIRLWHALSVQWCEVARAGVTLRLQADEMAQRQSIMSGAQVDRAILKDALKASLPLVLQATEVRARRSIENAFSSLSRAQCFELQLLRVSWSEQQQRNTISMQWHTSARNAVLPLSILKLAQLEEQLWLKEIDLRAAVLLSEWHSFESLKFDFLTKLQTLNRRQLLQEHKAAEDALLSSFVSSTHVLAIQHAAKGFRPNKS